MKSLHAQSARMIIIIIRRPTRGRIEFYFVDDFALLSFWYAGFVCLPLFFPLRFLLLDNRAKLIGSLTQTDWRLYRQIVKTVENKVKFTVRVDCNCFVFVTYNGSNRNRFMHDKYVTFFVIFYVRQTLTFITFIIALTIVLCACCEHTFMNLPKRLPVAL